MQGGDLALGVLESIPLLTRGTEGQRAWPSGKQGLAGSLREQDLQRTGRLSIPLTMRKSLATRVCAWFHTAVAWWAVSQGSIPPVGSSSHRRKRGSDKRTVLGTWWLDNLFHSFRAQAGKSNGRARAPHGSRNAALLSNEGKDTCCGSPRGAAETQHTVPPPNHTKGGALARGSPGEGEGQTAGLLALI